MAKVKVKFRESAVEGKTGTIYYQLCHGHEMRQINTPIRIYPWQWDAASGRVDVRPGEAGRELAAVRQRIDGDLGLLRTIIRDFDLRQTPYSPADVVARFRSMEQMTVLVYMKKQVAALEAAGRLGTARNYERALSSFSVFLGGGDISFAVFSELLVEDYDCYLRRRGVVRNTVSFYMRILRSVYNKAVEQRLAEQTYPFRHVYTGIDRTRKRAVDEGIIRRLNHLDLSASAALSFARDLFIFSYGTRGMAFVDLAYLRKTDIRDDMLRYVRHKTGQPLSVRLEPCTKAIAARLAERSRHTPYLFPILTSEEPVRAYAQYQVALNYYNRLLKKLSKLLGLEQGLSSYTSRHSWATAARNHNVPLQVISAGMGHTSERTTQIYLMMLENSVIDRANQGILASLNGNVSL